MKISVGEIAQMLQGTLEGNSEDIITYPAKIEDAHTGAISFLANPKYEKFVAGCQASALLVANDFSLPHPVSLTLIRVEDPYLAFAKILEYFAIRVKPELGIEDPVFIHPEARIGQDVYIGAFSYIGKDTIIEDGALIYPQTYVGPYASIGKNSILYPGVKVYHHCIIEHDCILHSGAVIGSDGFGFAMGDDSQFAKIPQTGNVVIEDHVEIGSNTSIDRAVIGSTRIMAYAKIDNLVQIAHNVEIGGNTAIAAQTGISGSTKLGNHCLVGGQVGFIGHINIADGTKINAQSGVLKSVSVPGTALSGTPAIPFRDNYKIITILNKLPELEKRIRELEKKSGKHS